MAVDVDDRTLFIGNLDKDVTEEILYELFLQAGPIDRVSIPSGRNDSFRYGFVTYKHVVSIEYAIELFKGTNLFKKELSIKKKSAKSNSNCQQSNDFNKYGNSELKQQRQNTGFEDNSQDNMLNMKNLQKQGSKYIQDNLVSFSSESIRGNWSSRNKPYNYGARNYASRARGPRDRHKDRDYGNKMYHGRQNRRRD